MCIDAVWRDNSVDTSMISMPCPVNCVVLLPVVCTGHRPGGWGRGYFIQRFQTHAGKRCKGLRFPDRSTTTDLPSRASFWCVGLTILGHPVSYTVFRYELTPAVATIGCMHACKTLLRALGLTVLTPCRNITVLYELFLMSACLWASVFSDLRKRMYKTGLEVAFDA